MMVRGRLFDLRDSSVCHSGICNCMSILLLLVILLGYYSMGSLSLLDSIKCMYFISCLTTALRHNGRQGIASV